MYSDDATATARGKLTPGRLVSGIADHGGRRATPQTLGESGSPAHRERPGCIPSRSMPKSLPHPDRRDTPRSAAGRRPSRARHVSQPVIATRTRCHPTTESLAGSGFVEALDLTFRGVQPGLERAPNRIPQVHRHIRANKQKQLPGLRRRVLRKRQILGRSSLVRPEPDQQAIAAARFTIILVFNL